MTNFKSFSATLFFALFLTGCMGVYEEGFDCPPGVGVGCKSISQVNTMVNKGLLPKPETEVSQVSMSEGAMPCKICPPLPHTSLPNVTANPFKFSIWWAPQWDRKGLAQPINLVPRKE